MLMRRIGCTADMAAGGIRHRAVDGMGPLPAKAAPLLTPRKARRAAALLPVVVDLLIRAESIHKTNPDR